MFCVLSLGQGVKALVGRRYSNSGRRFQKRGKPIDWNELATALQGVYGISDSFRVTCICGGTIIYLSPLSKSIIALHYVGFVENNSELPLHGTYF